MHFIYNVIGCEKIWIGIDDTDSLKGGCTTYLASELMTELVNNNYEIIGYPRLVRLNPNIPWKTRGNGAVSIQLINGSKKKIRCIIEKVFEKYAKFRDVQTNPGFVILEKAPSYGIYLRAVREIILLKEIEELLGSLEAEFKGYKNGRGLIGATASVAWSRKKDKTYELIAYREEKRWGTKRFVDDETTIYIDEKFPSTFDNYDYKNKHNRLVPNSPCPILYGIRGENINELIRAKSIIKSEKINSWQIFETNQGTDDHLQRKKIIDINPYESIVAEGVICRGPITIKGGHVIFKIEDKSGSIDCAAYEPTKEFRQIIRKLDIGDIVETFGGVRERPLTINLEKIKINYLENIIEKVENPICAKCKRHMRSKGSGQGYKCVKCGTRSSSPLLKKKERDIRVGFYEVPVCARRHISKPLKRMEP
jgi:tRNA(Ile2)-agmatinylcytidine synthase